MNGIKLWFTIITKSDTITTHLLIFSIIWVGWGSYTDFISAWKSGKNPSASKDTIKKAIPEISDSLDLYFVAGSNKLNRRTPIVRTIPTINFFLPNFNFFSFTREQKIATNKTDRTFEDLKTITTGKLVLMTAWVYV